MNVEIDLSLKTKVGMDAEKFNVRRHEYVKAALEHFLDNPKRADLLKEPVNSAKDGLPEVAAALALARDRELESRHGAKPPEIPTPKRAAVSVRRAKNQSRPKKTS